MILLGGFAGAWLTCKDGNGSVSGQISAGFRFCGFGLGMISHPRFSSSGPRNLSGSVLGLVLSPVDTQ